MFNQLHVRRRGSVSVNALDSGSRGCGFDPSRGRIHDFLVVGSSPGRGSPILSSLRGRYSGYNEFLVGRWSLQEWRPVCIVAMKQSNLTTLFWAQKPKCRLYGTFNLLLSPTCISDIRNLTRFFPMLLIFRLLYSHSIFLSLTAILIEVDLFISSTYLNVQWSHSKPGLNTRTLFS